MLSTVWSYPQIAVSRTADLKSLTCKQRALPRNFGSIGGIGIIELRVP
jgi:hypothetical protein